MSSPGAFALREQITCFVISQCEMIPASIDGGIQERLSVLAAPCKVRSTFLCGARQTVIILYVALDYFFFMGYHKQLAWCKRT